jgi:photosystem II stability/assembly factor-like uncharacterized protein
MPSPTTPAFCPWNRRHNRTDLKNHGRAGPGRRAFSVLCRLHNHPQCKDNGHQPLAIDRSPLHISAVGKNKNGLIRRSRDAMKQKMITTLFVATFVWLNVVPSMNAQTSPPSLAIAPNGNQIVVSWPLWASNYGLQTKSNLFSSNWSNVTGGISTVTAGYVFTNSATGHAAFFRLSSPGQNSYTVTVNQGANGAISPGTTTVNQGSNQTFTVTPNPNYQIASITIDGTNQNLTPQWTDLGTQGANSFIRSIVELGNGIVVGGGDTIVRSTNSGATWTDLGAKGGGQIILKLSYLGNGIVIAGVTAGKILRSTDYGATWTDLGTQFGQSHIYGLGNLGNGIVLAGTKPGGLLLRSADYGATWSNMGQLGSETTIYPIESPTNGIVLIGVATTGDIWRSTNSGTNWTNLGNQAGELDIDFITSIGAGVMIASTYPGGKMLRSTNYGLTWIDLGRFDTVDTMSSVAPAGNGVAIAGTGKDGHMWRTTDYGATWTNLGQLGSEAILRSMFLTNGTALVGTSPNGKIFRSTNAGTTAGYTFTNVQAPHTITASFVHVASP